MPMRREVIDNGGVAGAAIGVLVLVAVLFWGCGEGPCKNLRDCPAKSDAGVAALIGCGVEADAGAPDVDRCACPDAGGIHILPEGCGKVCGLE